MGLRSLDLHESALSPTEYAQYTALWEEIVEPPDDVLGVREARGWLKGRFSSMDGTTIDQILRLFYPSLLPQDTLPRGQFFAALRLITHVTTGKAVDPALVFVQPADTNILNSTPRAEISQPTSTNPSSYNSNNPFASRAYSHPTNNDTPASTPPRPPASSSLPKPVSTPLTKPASSPLPKSASRPVSNPPSSRSHPPPPPSTSALSSDESSVADHLPNHTIRASSSPVPTVPNPFLARANSIPQSIANQGVVVPPAPGVEGSKATPPALPPRKPSFLPPPRHASQQPASVASSGRSVSSVPPLKPPKPPHFSSTPTNINPPTTSSLPGHITSPLIKQGLLAAQGAKRSAEFGLDKLRTWEIIKTSSGSGGTTPSASTSTWKELGAGGRSVSSERERERATSVSSEGRARIQSTTRHIRNPSGVKSEGLGHSRSPPLPPGGYPRSVEEESPFGEPPTSPLELTSSTSASGTSYGRPTMQKDVFDPPSSSPSVPVAGVRMARSKSLHSGVPPIPPPRRRRPESVQIQPSTPTKEGELTWVMSGSFVDDLKEDNNGPFGDGSSDRVKPSVVRRTGVLATAEHDFTAPASNANNPNEVLGGANPVATLRNQFHDLKIRTRPGLESARAKVEGKLIPGGYGKWGAETLTSEHGPRRRATRTISTPAGRRGSEGSDEFEEFDDDRGSEDDVRRGGWKPLKG